MRANRAVAGVLCLGLLAACSSSERPSPSATAAPSVPSTTPLSASAPSASVGATTAAPARLLAGRPMIDCTIQSEAPVTATAPAVCGTLEVPEDRSNPSGRMIGLRVAVIPAEADTPEPDAFFALAGGPGRAGTAFFGWLPGLFADVHASRDIVLVDQRGTGGSNALVLPPMPDTTGLSQAEVDAHLQTWSDDWQASIEADPRQYTSSVAADDLDAVREALGYDLIDLYGPSYGATLAQYYIRQHPDHVRVAIMDGGTPLDVHGTRAHGRQQPGGARAPVRPLRRRRCLPRRPAGSVHRVVGVGGGARHRNRHRHDRSELRRADGGDARPSRPGHPPGAVGPRDRRPAAARGPPRPRGAVGPGRPDLAGVDWDRATGWR